MPGEIILVCKSKTPPYWPLPPELLRVSPHRHKFYSFHFLQAIFQEIEDYCLTAMYYSSDNQNTCYSVLWRFKPRVCHVQCCMRLMRISDELNSFDIQIFQGHSKSIEPSSVFLAFFHGISFPKRPGWSFNRPLPMPGFVFQAPKSHKLWATPQQNPAGPQQASLVLFFFHPLPLLPHDCEDISVCCSQLTFFWQFSPVSWATGDLKTSFS